MSPKVEATIDDLYHIPENGKAEIIDGEIVLMSPTGRKPGYAAGEIFVSLREGTRHKKMGLAVSDNSASIVNLPNRKSFSPDVAFYVGPAAERRIAKKRADYFAAGTKVQWDVDLLSDDVIKVYRADNPDKPTIYRRGNPAEAEPAVPGWRFPVDNLFE